MTSLSLFSPSNDDVIGTSSLQPLHIDEETSDDNQSEDWGIDENDWHMSSSSEPQAPLFSLLTLPLKLRNSVFRRSLKTWKPLKLTIERPSTTRTSSLTSTPRESVLLMKQHEEEEEVKHVEKFRTFWDDKLRHAMEKIGAVNRYRSHTAQEDVVFHLLLKLYAHQDVVEELYSNYGLHADEFVFYIPQLCTFFMHGNYAKQQQLESFLMSKSGESLSFAHRLTWFLRSFCSTNYHSRYSSVTASRGQENLHILKAIGKRAGVPALLMNNGLCVEEVMATKPDNLMRRRWTSFPSDDEMVFMTYQSDESFAGHLLRRRNSVQDEARNVEGNFQQIYLFNQTPRFVEALTDLAEYLILTPFSHRNTELRKGLRLINDQLLPSDVVYLPIGNPHHRVKCIRAEECFTFSTKQRVPYFLCVEVLDYSVTSSPAASKKRPKKQKSKASRNQTRGFSLKLPFKRDDADLEAAVNDTPISSITSLESELSSMSSPGASSPLPEIDNERSMTSLPLSTSLQDGNDGVILMKERTDAKDCSGKKQEDEQMTRDSFQEKNDLERVEEEQQERLGQWNLPRPHRRSIKKCHKYSASSRSREQFESFCSSWAMKKTPQCVNDTERALPAYVQTKTDDTAGKSIAGCVMNGNESAAKKEVIVGVCNEEVEVETRAFDEELFVDATSTNTEPMAGSATGESAFRQLTASSNQPVAVSHTNKKGACIGCEPFNSDVSKTVSDEQSVALTSAAQAPSPFSTVLRTSHTISLGSSSSSEKTPTTTTVSDEEGNAAYVSEPEDTCTSDFAKKSSSEATVKTPDAITKSSCVLKQSKEGAMDEFGAEHADGEKSKSNETVVTNDNVVDKVLARFDETSEGAAAIDDLAAEDADGEDTDSNSGSMGEDDKVAGEPESVIATKRAEKPTSFISWFYRKPVTERREHKVAEKLEDAPAESDGEMTSRESKNSAVDHSKPLTPVVKSTSVSGSEAPFEQRRRDLSISLDFADPTAWKEKFDLDDDLTDDASDEEGVDDDSAEEEHVTFDAKDDAKPMIVFRERWSEKEARIRSESPYGEHPGWRLLSVIVKSNDDLRQEQFAAQLIAQCDRIFREYSLPLSLRPYNVIATSAKTGLIEAVPDTVSLDSLKRNDPSYTTLLDFYIRLHGNKDTAGFTRAQRNFVESLAAYSMVCYVFQIKDRHNGNILVDTDGHVIHIDFGFLLTNSPGSNWNFERAPFKLTDEFVELLGGARSSTFRYFRSLCIRAYLALRRNMDQIVLLVEMMLVGNADLPCFAGGKKTVIEGLRARLKPGARTSTCQVFVNQLIDQSMNNWRTRWYDKYQRACLGIL